MSGQFSETDNLDAVCDCAVSRMFSHRKVKCSGRLLAPGLNVKNESEFPILFVLSQLSPLHWDRVEPGATRKINCGRVLFTASTEIYDPATEPTVAGVTARLLMITAVTVVSGGVWGLGVVGAISGMTSAKGVKMDGILADGRTCVVRGRLTTVGAYELYISLEN
jgi:hypothetical protein